jgi:uncharacterized protein (UPF0261 family)
MKTIAVLATLDTKGPEAEYVRAQIEALGGAAMLIDMGVVGEAGGRADVAREAVAATGGGDLAAMLKNPTRQAASPVMVAGATKILSERIASGEVHAALGLGGTQGTSNCTAVMRALPYGFPKVMVSTVASGDVSAFVGMRDITMMFSVGDILGLNPLTRKILANAAAAAWGMAQSPVALEPRASGKPVIGVTNLGVLTEGAMAALARINERGYEAIVFHAVGSGGRAMEQMMREGVIGAVFDYALGEIADDLHGALRAGGPERLTVAAELGLPQVLCPGGAEHIGLLLGEPNVVPERWRGHRHVFHNPVILAPRLKPDELAEVGREIGRRLAKVKGRAQMLFPLRGTSRYGIEGMPLHDPAGDRAFLEALRESLPPTVELIERDTHAEDPVFVREAVDRLIELIEGRGA